MTRPIRLPQIPQTEKERREEYRKREQAIEDARKEAYLAKRRILARENIIRQLPGRMNVCKEKRHSRIRGDKR